MLLRLKTSSGRKNDKKQPIRSMMGGIEKIDSPKTPTSHRFGELAQWTESFGQTEFENSNSCSTI